MKIESKFAFNKKYYVKICAGKQRALKELMYFKDDMKFDLFMKWQWYFKYREALIRVAHPRWYVDIDMGSYDYVPKIEEEITRLKNKIKAAKSKITEWSNKLSEVENNWDKLFAITEDERYHNTINKINEKRFNLKNLEEELKQLESKQ
ncbi:MAG: hypothetical protein LBE36_13470 [Flavobacteriaceae bacterium]|jgi:hypothetical protein|nr:hypothetical protein [Flavobacteriaceae bacterium]